MAELTQSGSRWALDKATAAARALGAPPARAAALRRRARGARHARRGRAPEAARLRQLRLRHQLRVSLRHLHQVRPAALRRLPNVRASDSE